MKEVAGCFGFLLFMACVLSVFFYFIFFFIFWFYLFISLFFALPLGVIGRLCSVNEALLGHLLC